MGEDHLKVSGSDIFAQEWQERLNISGGLRFYISAYIASSQILGCNSSLSSSSLIFILGLGLSSGALKISMMIIMID